VSLSVIEYFLQSDGECVNFLSHDISAVDGIVKEIAC